MPKVPSYTWAAKKLGTMCQLAGGYGFPESFQGYVEGELPFIKVSDMSLSGNERRIVNANNYVNMRLAESMGWRPFPAGAIVFAKVGAALKLNRRRILIRPTLIDNNMMAAIPLGGLDSAFLYHFLCSVDFDDFVQDGALPSVNQEQIGSIKIPDINKDEQRHIAEILDTIDEAIQKTEALISKLKAMKQGLLHDLLTCGLDKNGKLRDPKAHPEQFKDSLLGRIPKDWDIHSLEDFSKYISYGFTNPMPSTTEGPWMITAFDIGDGIIKYKQARHTSMYSFNHQLTPKSKPSKGDLLITKDGTLGRVAIVDSEYLCINQSVACIQPLPNADISFLFHYLQAQNTQERMLADAGGSAIKHIYVSKLRNLEIVYPERKEREKIVKIINSHDIRIRTEEQYHDKLKLQKKGLMHDLLTGKVRVKV